MPAKQPSSPQPFTKREVNAATFVLLGSCLGLAIWFPEPSRFQAHVLGVLLALGAAVFATRITGTIAVQLGSEEGGKTYRTIQATGAVAIFLAVFYATPHSTPGGPVDPNSLDSGGHQRERKGD